MLTDVLLQSLWNLQNQFGVDMQSLDKIKRNALGSHTFRLQSLTFCLDQEQLLEL